jgi:hypothetical protein
MHTHASKHVLPTLESATEFDELVAAKQPCILKLPLAPGELGALRDRVNGFLRGADSIDVLLGDTCDGEVVAGAEFMRHFEGGRTTLNVLEHFLSPEQARTLYIPPVFASTQTNLMRSLDGDINPVSLVASPQYAHTVPHVDSGAFGNWMVLVSGVKLWMLVSPEDEHLCFNQHSRTWSFDDEYKTGIIHYGTLEANQLLFAPAGWVHGVITLERSIGYGGQFIDRTDLAPCKRIVETLHARGIDQVHYVELIQQIEASA